ncbi:MAG TPA: hypothetical protein VK338_05340, partial [Candidatus Nitrosocosmicus sp.]|nr:hypothetical protein [Candidatus Nitrosocosmicus sp.]
PKCSNALVMAVTRFGKKMKRCSTNVWDPATKQSTGCDYIEWITGTTENLEEDCPECGEKLVMFTTTAGKRLKKCSTATWNKELKIAEGCTFVEWQK